MEQENIILKNEAQEIKYSNYLPVWKFVLLNIISFGAYQFYWFYKNWKIIKRKMNLTISAPARTIFTIIFAYSFCKKILIIAKEKGYKCNYSSALITISYILMSILASFPNPYSLISVFEFLPLIYVLKAINFYWLQEQPGYKINIKLSKGETIFTVIFGMFFILVLIRIFG